MTISMAVNVSLAQVRRVVERGPVQPGLPRVRRVRRGQAVRRLRRAVRADLAEGRPHGERTVFGQCSPIDATIR